MRVVGRRRKNTERVRVNGGKLPSISALGTCVHVQDTSLMRSQ